MRLLALALIAGSLFAQETPIRLILVASGLSQPTDIQHTGDGRNRLFIVQQGGRIRILKNGTLLPNPFLDITGRVLAGGERGLLGLAFPPEYPRKNYFYLNYTQLSGNTVIARYRTTSDPDIADPNSEAILLTINQPFSNHNGGQLRFGPDGFLYIGMGDGGSGGDPFNNAQNPGSLLGKMLRIDVESDLAQIRIPPDNPFVNDASYQPAIWALGVRNPWRFSFDRATGDLWIADVGQDRAEEINFQPALSKGGENYGWNLMEGLRCYRSGCNAEGLTLPVLEYSHAEGCSVTGGQVYRGSGSPGLRGTYLYGDFCSGRIWGLRREGGEWINELLLASNLSISTFGEDEAGEVYVADHARGEIYRVEGSKAPRFSPASVVNGASFQQGIVAGSASTIFVAGVMDSAGIVRADRIPLPTSLGGVSVSVNDQSAPLFAVANLDGTEQVNLQVPFEVAGSTTAPVVVSRNGVASNPVQVPVLPAQPGIFTTNGIDAIVVHHQGNTLVTPESPLDEDEFAYFYTTGLGPIDNNPGTGNPGPRNPLARTKSLAQVTIGGVPCEVLYAGLAPDFVGVFQINVRVPRDVFSGSQDLVITIDGVASPPTKVAVR